MTEFKAKIQQIEEDAVQALRRFRNTVDRDELKARMGDSNCEVLVNRELTICYATPMFERFFGYETEQLEGHPITIVIPAQFHQSHAAHTAAYTAAPSRRKMSERPDLKGLKRNGEEVTVRIELRDIYFHGAPYFVAQVFEGGAGTGGLTSGGVGGGGN